MAAKSFRGHYMLLLVIVLSIFVVLRWDLAIWVLTQYGSYMGFPNSSGLTPTYEPDRRDVQGAVPIPTCAAGNLVLLRNRLTRFPHGSTMHTKAQEELDEALASMERTDIIIERINEWLLKNNETSARDSNYTSSSCFSSLMEVYGQHCGFFSIYTLSHGQDIQKMCDQGVTESQMNQAAIQACDPSIPHKPKRNRRALQNVC